MSANAPAIYHPPAYCKQSTLTGVEFMQAIQFIIAHNDLTDLAFTEKTIGANFRADDKTSSHSQIDSYQADQVLNSPVRARLQVVNFENNQLRPNWISSMRIESLGFSSTAPAFIEDCLHIKAANFSSYFGNGFQVFAPLGDTDVAVLDAIQTPYKPTRTDSKLGLSFTFNPKNSLILDLGIVQRP